MKKTIIISVIAVLVTNAFNAWFSYGAGVIDGRKEMREEKPCLLCDRSVNELHAFSTLDIEPDSAMYCHDCHKVHLFFPGMEYMDEKPQMQRLQLVGEYVKFSAN